jgi:hypothetical protein
VEGLARAYLVLLDEDYLPIILQRITGFFQVKTIAPR